MIDSGFHGCRISRRRVSAKLSALVVALVAACCPLSIFAQTPVNTAAVPADATVAELFTDFLHYARLGRFTMADAFGQALLDHPDLDPVVVLEVAGRDPKSLDTLLILVKSSTIGQSAAQILDLLNRGEQEQRKESERIYANIDKLGGSPQQEWIAMRNLARSGEYAVPALIGTLLDHSKSDLRRKVVNALITVGKPAVNPLVMALGVDDVDVRQSLIGVLGEIGYPQAIPYLRRLSVLDATPREVREAALIAIDRIEQLSGRPYPGSAGDSLYHLATRYFDEDPSVRADPRIDTANVWYWDAELQAIVPTVVQQDIFAPVMAMRCCEDALNLRSDHGDALALWLASNIRREARLGFDVESGDPNETATPDATRPEDFPRALYFTQAAGPTYAHRVLDRALDASDAPVALGAIEALRVTAGPASLVGRENHKQALARALKFPDRVVRIRTALALGAALPQTTFAGWDLVIPTIAEALALNGKTQIVVIDNNEHDLNRTMDALRTDARYVTGDTNSFRAFAKVRSQRSHINGAFISTGISNPGIGVTVAQLRSEESFRLTPIVVMAKESQIALARTVAMADPYAEAVDAMADGQALEAALKRARGRAGQTEIDTALALEIALQAANTLEAIAADGRSVFRAGRAETALLVALASDGSELRTKSAAVLAYLPTTSAQSGIAMMGFDADIDASLRVAAFTALAQSGKRNGSLLDDEALGRLVDVALSDPDLTIREAASRALGALNPSASRPGDIIRSFQKG